MWYILTLQALGKDVNKCQKETIFCRNLFFWPEFVRKKNLRMNQSGNLNWMTSSIRKIKLATVKTTVSYLLPMLTNCYLQQAFPLRTSQPQPVPPLLQLPELLHLCSIFVPGVDTDSWSQVFSLWLHHQQVFLQCITCYGLYHSLQGPGRLKQSSKVFSCTVFPTCRTD